MEKTDVIGKLNSLLADSSVMFTKLHNYHWNVKGMQFYGIHEKTEELYGHFAELYDALAERILQLRGRPLVTLSEVLESTRLKEDSNSSFSAEYVIENILVDFEFFLKEFNELSQTIDLDTTTTAISDEQISFLDKEIWMLRSMLG
jgi:starvation-inducible DNA-binding protein